MHLQLLPAQLTQIKIDVIGCVRGAMFHQLPIVVWIYRTKHGLVHYEQLQPCLIQLATALQPLIQAWMAGSVAALCFAAGR